MSSNLFRYFRERQDADGEQLHWPGGPGGFPFRGAAPQPLRDDEYENLRPVFKVRCHTFYLNDKDAAREYMLICAKIANGIYILRDRERSWDEGTKNYRIYLEWSEPAYESPQASGSGGRSLDNPSGVKNDAIANLIADDPANTTTFPYGRLAGLQGETGW